MIHTDEDDEFDRILRENRLKGQPYHWEADAIKAALEAKDEIVEWKMGASGIGGTGVIVQPQRTWVGLTDEEIMQVMEIGLGVRDSIETALDKLKEKNT
jgi:hypothetical protein